MRLFNYKMSDYPLGGYSWSSLFNDWFKDRVHDHLIDYANNGVERNLLEKVQDIVNRSGATNLRQVEYIYELENRLQDMDRALKRLYDDRI